MNDGQREMGVVLEPPPPVLYRKTVIVRQFLQGYRQDIAFATDEIAVFVIKTVKFLDTYTAVPCQVHQGQLSAAIRFAFPNPDGKYRIPGFYLINLSDPFGIIVPDGMFLYLLYHRRPESGRFTF